MELGRARGRADRTGGGLVRVRAQTQGASPSGRGVGGARGRERAGPTRSHPEPGRDPAQRRRVLWGRPHGRRGRRGHPPPSYGVGSRKSVSGSELIAPSRKSIARRGVEQRQLVGLITQRSGVRIPPPLPVATPAPVGAGVAVSFSTQSCFNLARRVAATIRSPGASSNP